MHDEYVNRDAWQDPGTRADAIDDVADQFERRTGTGWPHSTANGARTDAASRWPSRSRGWRSAELLHPRAAPHPSR